jgi:PKD repeat protein
MKNVFLVAGLLLSIIGWSQPANDNCTGSTVVPQDGTCVTSTTVAATDSWSGAVGCQSGDGHEDVWFTFVATGTQADLIVTNGTMTGNVEIIFVLANCNSQNCNCPFLLAGNDCAASPNSITVTPLIVGETYYYTISSSTGSQGTFTACLTVTTPPPPPPLPGQDCVTGATLCGGPDFTVPVMDLGDGAVEENTTGGWSSCIGNETSSQWYQFTAGAAGSFSLLVDPATWNAGSQTGDDYDWELYNITTSACTNSATSLACDYSACPGSTGFSPTGGPGLGQTAGTDYANTGNGPLGCSGTFQWNLTTVNLVAGNTYALMIQNYTGSTGGATVDWAGAALMGPQSAFTFSNACGIDNIAGVSATYPNAIAGWTFSWDWGDGTVDGTGTTATHTYVNPGNYNVTLTVTDPLGCTSSSFSSTSCTLPIELVSFFGEYKAPKTQLKWTTLSETNNDYFTIERSTDGIHYEMLGTVDGAGNSNNPISYSFDDENPFMGTNYYRLTQTDFDGKFVRYDPFEVMVNDEATEFLVFPNPTEDVFNLDFSSYSFEPVTIKVMDLAGKIVYGTILQSSFDKRVTFKLDASNFIDGTYLIYIQQEDRLYSKKVTVKH